MGDIWILLIEDRHAEADARPFSTEEAAVAAARQAVTDNARHAEDIDWDAGLNESMRADGWVFYVPYSGEGDCVRVLKRAMNAVSA